MSVEKQSFGITKKGEAISLYTVTNKNGMVMKVTDFGAILVSVLVPDKNGVLTDVVLGYDHGEDYQVNSPHFFSAVVPFFFECSLLLPSVALPAVFQDTFFLPPSVFLPIFPAETSSEKLSQHLQSSISISMEYFYMFHHFFPYLSIWHFSENYPAGLVMFSVKICDFSDTL